MEENRQLHEEAKTASIMGLNSIQESAVDIKIADRSAPRWALPMALLFSLSTHVILGAACISLLFLSSLVAKEGHANVAALILGVIFIPLVGTVFIDWAYRQALTGLKGMRDDLLALSDGIIATMGLVFLGAIHPFLPIPVISAVLLSSGFFMFVRYTRLTENWWDFNPEEAASFLSGRDSIGLELAQAPPTEHGIVASLHRFTVILAGVAGFACAAFLVSANTMDGIALGAVGALSALLANSFMRLLRHKIRPQSPRDANTSVRYLATAEEEDLESVRDPGLCVKNLSVLDRKGERLLNDICLNLAPGSITQIIGESGDGKSLLLRALSDPFSVGDAEVQGLVELDGEDCWQRSRSIDRLPMVRITPEPMLVDSSAVNNLTCFQDDRSKQRAERILSHLIHSEDITSHLLSDDRAQYLPMNQQKLLTLARAFLLSPNVYLFDLPENYLSHRQISRLQEMLKLEAQRGKIIILVTDDRALSSLCDYVLVLQNGLNVDFDEATALRRRQGSGWRRFVGARSYETEDLLKSWLRSLYVRQGDEQNRRNICRVGVAILTYFCQNASADGSEQIFFECLKKEGALMIKAYDNGEPISQAQLEAARQKLSEDSDGSWSSPLVNIVRDCVDVQIPDTGSGREIVVQIAATDPRNKPES